MNSRFGRARPALVGLLLTSGFAIQANAESSTDVDDNNFREDVILCEEAVAHITECCGYSVQSDACHNYHSYTTLDCGCMSSGDGWERVDVWPVLAVGDSLRFAKTSCSALTEEATDGVTTCAQLKERLDAENERRESKQQDCH